MAIDPNLCCPTCARPWPERTGRICSKCHLPIARHDRWSFVGGRVEHRDCNDRDLSKHTAKLREEKAVETQLTMEPAG